MKIDIIYIACFRHDVYLTKILVASIRRWYPEIPICLIKDRFYGDFGTREIERTWKVSVFETDRRSFSWGFGKLEPLFREKRERCLILDSDIVFVGPVLDRLAAFDEDFIVQHEDPTAGFVESHYFALDRLRALDPTFQFPGYSFNTGQLVATSGILRREDFAPFVRWQEPPELEQPDVFKYGEQGLLNYMLMKQQQDGRLTMKRERFMEVGNNPEVEVIRLEELGKESPYHFVVHWCGLRKPEIAEMVRGDILVHFEDAYYRKVPFGGVKRRWRIASKALQRLLQRRLRDGVLHQGYRRVKDILGTLRSRS